jgi:outer membrane receptor protein involved in Fe transport
VVYLGYLNQDALLQSERDFSACSLAAGAAGFSCGGSGTNATGRITNLTTGTVWTNGDNNGTARRFSNALDQYNFGPLNHYQRPDERYTAAFYANYDVTPQAKIYTEFNFMDDNSVAQIAPGGVFGSIATIRGDNPLLSASWRSALGLTSPDSTTDVVVQRRNVEGGGRQSEYRHTAYREVFGVKGEVAKWNYDVYGEAAKVIYSQVQQNYFLNQRIDNALDVVNVNGVAQCRSAVNGTDPACVPYNVWQLGQVTNQQLAYLQAPGMQRGSTQQSFYGATVSSDLGEYGVMAPGAKSGVGVVFGAERRTEKLDLLPDANVGSGSLSGSGGPTPSLSGKYTVNEYFMEARAPIIEGQNMADSLALSGSFRHSSYSTDQSTNTYGLGIDWAPVKEARIRGSYQSAIRAANVVELYQQQGLNLFDMNADPCGGPNPSATREQCARTGVTAAQYGNIQNSPAGQYNYLQGGNPTLNPEEAKTYTLGLVLTPTKDFSASIDYYDIKIDKAIGNVSPTTILNNCLTSGQFCALIQRDRLGTLWLLNTGFITATNQNLGTTKTSGFDFGMNHLYRFPDGYGRLTTNFIGTYLRELQYEPIPNLGKFDCVGLYGANKCGSPNPEWRHKLRFTWGTPWSVDASFTWRYIASVKVQESDSQTLLAGPYNAVEQKLGSQNYIDLAATWAATKQLTLLVGINNLLDKDPPITTQQGPSVFGNGNTFPGVYDALGRKVFANVTYKF